MRSDNMMYKISVIVPVYNTKKYLSRCLDSILSQSFTDFELLLIDDGSTDDSGVICDAYAEKDNRIRVFHKENGGVSSARNLGINNASGKWIYFVDSDDELLPDGLKTLVENVSEGADVVMAGYEDVDENGNRSCQTNERRSLRLTQRQSVTTIYTGSGLYYFYMGYPWMRLFRNDLVKRLNIRFDSDIAIKEDSLFVMQYVCRSNGITQYTTRPVYRYYQRPGSAMSETKHFDLKYVSSFYAFVKMKHEVESVFPSHSEPVFIAKQGILGRFESIIGKMDAFGVCDDALKQQLFDTMKKEVGSIFLFKLRRKMRKLMKKQVVYDS